MSSKNLKKWAKVLIEDFADEKSKTGAKNEKRLAYEKTVPQVFIQQKQELKNEINSLRDKGGLSGTAKRKQYGKDKPTYFRGKQLNEREKSGGSTKAVHVDVPPPITMTEEAVIKIWKTTFKTFKDAQKKDFTSEKKRGSNGDPITKDDWTELSKAAKRVTRAEYICPVIDLTAARDKLKKVFGDAVAKAEIVNRKKSKGPRETSEIEQKYISARITGHQGAKFSVGGKQELYRKQGLTEAEKASGIQLGHGEYSDPTFLNTAKEAEAKIDKLVASGKLTTEEGKILKAGVWTSKQKWKVHLEHNENLSLKSGFRKSYRLVIISGQRTSSNMKDKEVEAKMAAPIREWWRYIAKPGEHKTRLFKSVGNLLLDRMVTGTHRRIKNTSKRWKPMSRVRSKERSSAFTYNYKEKRRLVIRGGAASGLASGAKKSYKDVKRGNKPSKRATPASSLGGSPGSPMQAIAMFNSSLEEAIRDNMGSPALNYQTGRFAESVKVFSITPSMGTSGIIQYAYRKNPYQLYEGDGMRDPRLLIDKTLREQAAELALGKFTTQRV